MTRGEHFQVTSETGKKMFGYSSGYERSYLYKKLMQSEGEEFDKYRACIAEILNQFYVRTATWGLDIWENELGLPSDTSLTDRERQDRIVSKLRGQGTATIALVKSVAAAYENGAIAVIEDFAASTIIVKFIDTTGIPSNIDDLKVAVRDVVPGALEILYELRYLLIKEIHNSMTINMLQAQPISNFAGGA